MPFDFHHDTIEDCLVGLVNTLTAAANDWDGDHTRADTLAFVRLIRDICGYAKTVYYKARYVAEHLAEIDRGMDHVSDAETYHDAAEAIRATLHDSCLLSKLAEWEVEVAA